MTTSDVPRPTAAPAGPSARAPDAPPSAQGGVPTPVDILLVCSSGGHLLQLMALRDAWGELTRAWVTDDTPDTRSVLGGEDVTFAHGPTSRNLKTMMKNAFLAWGVIRTRRPAVILTTGAAIAVPFAWVARMCGVCVVYVESVTRITRPSLSARMVAPVVSRLYVQWPDLVGSVRRARYCGSVFSDP